MSNLLEQEINKIEKSLITLKTASSMRADSALLYRLFLDYSRVYESRKYTIEVAPKNGNYNDLIVMPIAYTGEISGIASFSNGIGLDVVNPCVIHFYRYYSSDKPKTSSSVMVYSNAELYIKSENYTI